jgi:hypothetical protein
MSEHSTPHDASVSTLIGVEVDEITVTFRLVVDGLSSRPMPLGALDVPQMIAEMVQTLTGRPCVGVAIPVNPSTGERQIISLSQLPVCMFCQARIGPAEPFEMDETATFTAHAACLRRPAPELATELSHPEGTVCDVCSSPEIRYDYPCKPFTLPHLYMGNADDWALCEPCAELVEANRRPELRLRAIEAALGDERITPAQRLSYETMVQALHDAFFSHRSGPRVEIGDGPA